MEVAGSLVCQVMVSTPIIGRGRHADQHGRNQISHGCRHPFRFRSVKIVRLRLSPLAIWICPAPAVPVTVATAPVKAP
jgi:hypothetical protein